MNGVGSARQIPHQWGGYIGAERVGTGRLVAVTSVRRWWLHRCQRWWLHRCGEFPRQAFPHLSRTDASK